MKIPAIMIATLAVASLAGCSSAPKPPNVRGWHRVAVNMPADVQALQLQVFPDPPAAPQTVYQPAVQPPYSRTVTVHFPYNNTTFRPTTGQEAQLRGLLREGYRRVEVRGRTDAVRQSPGDQYVAAGRASAARSWLIQNGVPAEVIEVNYASAADPIGGSTYSSGRALNRRVDIEVIRK